MSKRYKKMRLFPSPSGQRSFCLPDFPAWGTGKLVVFDAAPGTWSDQQPIDCVDTLNTLRDSVRHDLTLSIRHASDSAYTFSSPSRDYEANTRFVDFVLANYPRGSWHLGFAGNVPLIARRNTKGQIKAIIATIGVPTTQP
jgi:hypothetical protein